ncbi:hypothetical protein [Pseudomonas sp. TE3610]
MNEFAARADWTLDPSFGTDGKTILNFDLISYSFLDFCRLSDGSFLVFTRQDKNYLNYSVLKLTESGNLDPQFGHQGEVILESTMAEQFTSLHIVDDTFVVLGHSSDSILVFRYLLDGTADVEFGNAGELRIKVSTLPPDTSEDSHGPHNLAMGLGGDEENNMVVSKALGTVDGDRFFIVFNVNWPEDIELGLPEVPVIICLDETGELDSSFNGGRPKFLSLISPWPKGNYVSAVATQRTTAGVNNLLLFGTRPSAVGSRIHHVLRVLSDGQRDYTFGDGEADDQGLAIITTQQLLIPNGLTVDTDESIKAWGLLSESAMGVRSFDVNGKNDGSFGEAGYLSVNSKEWNGATSSGTTDDYRFTVFHADQAEKTIRVLRFLASGKPDASFGNNGVVSISDELGRVVHAGKINVLPDNSVILAVGSVILKLRSQPS